MERADIVIVGAGHGGSQAAIALRQLGFDGSITMIGRDAEPPYERPPLTKDYLTGEKPFERMLIRPEKFWEDRGVALKLRAAVTALDPQEKFVNLADGTNVGFGTLIWAAGGDPRRLSCPGSELGGIHTVRDRHHVDALLADIESGARRVVVVGGGYIGLEAAAALRSLGCEVTVVEARDRVLSRVAGEDLSRFFEAQHRGRGVNVILDAEIHSLAGIDGRVTGVQLEDGATIPCDLVVVGIGIVPAVGPLISAGAAGANGVDVDEYCRTSFDDVYAIGDCAAHANPYAAGAVIRLESVQNAHDMAKTAAHSICGDPQPYNALPWFWSNQYDLRLQTAGLSMDYDTTVLRGNPEDKSFSVVYMREGRVVAVDAVNKTKDYVHGTKLIEARTEVTPEEVLETEVLKELL